MALGVADLRGRLRRRQPHARPVYGALDRREDPYGSSVRFGSAYLVLAGHVGDRTTYCFPDSVLDDYVEAHVHGGVDLARDVVAVVLDPCFRGGPVEEAARAMPCEVRWHPGFRVATAALEKDYRGAEPLVLARSLGGVSGELTPDVVGEAARSGAYDPQVVKKVWHLLARFGRR